MYLSKPTLLCGLTFNCVKSQMKYIPLSGIWGGLWRIGVRFSRDRCSHRRVRRGRGWTRGGFFRFLCRFVSFCVIQLWKRGGIFGYLCSFRPVWHAFRVDFSANCVALCHLYPCCVSRGRWSGPPHGRGTGAGKHYGKASLPGLERGWCHGWALCCWWKGFSCSWCSPTRHKKRLWQVS